MNTMHAAAHARAESASSWRQLLLILGGGIVSAFQVGKVPIALESMQNDLGMDLAAGAWLISAFAVVGALLGAPVGRLAQGAGARRLFLAGLGAQAIGSLIGALSGQAGILLLSRIIEGLGFLGLIVAAPTLLARIDEPRLRAYAMSAWATFMPVGMALITLGAPLLPGMGWRGLWLANAVLLAAYMGLAAVALRDAPAVQAAPSSLRRAIADALKDVRAWLLSGLFAGYAAAYFVVFGFLPVYVAQKWQAGVDESGVFIAFAVLLGAAGNMLGGAWLARGASPTRVILAGLAVMALTSIAVYANHASLFAAYAACTVFSCAGGMVPAALMTAAATHARRQASAGMTMGLVMQGNNAGILIGPAVAGALAAHLGWSALWQLNLGIIALCVVLAWGLIRLGNNLIRGAP